MTTDEPLPPDMSDETGHLGWRISALLDGELAAAEELVAREHLAGCDVCQQEFAEVMAARAFVRGLGEVEPPQGFVERVLARTRRRSQARFGLLALVTLAILWVVVLLVWIGVAVRPVEPPLPTFVQHHELARSDPQLSAARPDVRVIDDAEADSFRTPYVLPRSLAPDFERQAAYDLGDGTVQVVLTSGGDTVSVFEQAGSLVRDALPAGGDEVEIDGRRVWLGTLDGGRGGEAEVAVVTDGDLVTTLVSTDGVDLEALVPELPEAPSYALTDRARDNVEDLAERLGLD